MLAIQAIRKTHGETNLLIDTPGHLIETTNPEQAITLLSLTTAFKWTTYLYVPENQTTLLSWEGDLIDFWTNDLQTHNNIQNLIQSFKLKLPPPPNSLTHQFQNKAYPTTNTNHQIHTPKNLAKSTTPP